MAIQSSFDHLVASVPRAICRRALTSPRLVQGTVLFLAALAAGCSASASAASADVPLPVRAEPVSGAGDAGPLRYSGSLEPERRVDLAFRVGGYVEALAPVQASDGTRPIDKGDFVKQGTVLARVRVADYAEKLLTSQAQVGEARAQATLADEELKRANVLFAGGAITQAELDSKRARSDSTHAQVAGAVARAREAGLSVGDTVLRAPLDGVVLSRQIEVGTLVSPGQLALSVADTRRVKAVFGVPQVEVERLAVGDPVTVFVGAENESKTPDKLLTTRISRIAPAADANGRVFSVEALLPNDAGELRPGTVVSVRVPPNANLARKPVVPLRAVIRSPHETRGFSVFVLDGAGERARAVLRDVELGEVVGNGVTVKRGLTGTERVVTLGANLLHDGESAVVIR